MGFLPEFLNVETPRFALLADEDDSFDGGTKLEGVVSGDGMREDETIRERTHDRKHNKMDVTDAKWLATDTAWKGELGVMMSRQEACVGVI